MLSDGQGESGPFRARSRLLYCTYIARHAERRGIVARKRRGFGAIRLLASGRYQASYIGPDGARHVSPTTYRTRTDAEYWLLDERRLLELAGPDAWESPAARARAEAPQDSPTLRQFADEWLDAKIATGDVRETTAAKHRQALRLRVLDFGGKPALGDTPIADLTSRQVSAWWRKLDHKTHPRACDLAYQALRAMLNYAIAEEMIESNPCKVRGAGAPSVRRSIEPLTPSQVQALADAMRPAEWGLAVQLGAWCALRSGEVREIRKRDLDLSVARPVIHIRRAVVRATTTLAVGPVKTDAGRRDVLIPRPLLAALQERADSLPADGLLISQNGQSVDDRQFGRAWRRARDEVGLPGARYHDLRHVGLTYSAVAGATVRELQQIAGHTTPAMAMRYQEVASAHLAEVVDRLGTIMSPPPPPAPAATPAG